MAELSAKVMDGFTDFDFAVAAPAAMTEVRKIARVLGPRGLMPNPKAGTVTEDTAAAVEQLKAGRVEFRVDKNSNIAVPVGKASFDEKQLLDNSQAIVDAINNAKPASAKGIYMQGGTLAASMSPGVRIDSAPLAKV